jgi:hypothetical protein
MIRARGQRWRIAVTIFSNAAIAGECAPGKIGHDLARTQVLK